MGSSGIVLYWPMGSQGRILLLDTETTLKVCDGLSKAFFVPENPA